MSDGERAGWPWWRTVGLVVSPGWGIPSLAVLVLAGSWREVLAVALPEELVFRGVLQGEIERRRGPGALAIVVSATAFALCHTVVAGAAGLLTFFPGLLFAALRRASGSVWPAVAAHAAANRLWLS